MKRLSLFLCVAVLATTGFAAQNANALPSPDEHPGGWNFDVLFSPRKTTAHRRWLPSQNPSFSLGFISGINQAEGVHLNMGQSVELELNHLLAGQVPVTRNSALRLSLGIGWRNYRMTNRQMFAKHDDGSIAVEPYPEGVEPKGSRIHTFGFVLPLKYYQKLGRGYRSYFAIGPELYYAPHACLKTTYRNEDGKQRLKNNDLNFNKVSIGVGAEIVVLGAGIYYKYNPFNVLETDYGPEFSTMTVGLKLVL